MRQRLVDVLVDRGGVFLRHCLVILAHIFCRQSPVGHLISWTSLVPGILSDAYFPAVLGLCIVLASLRAGSIRVIGIICDVVVALFVVSVGAGCPLPSFLGRRLQQLDIVVLGAEESIVLEALHLFSVGSTGHQELLLPVLLPLQVFFYLLGVVLLLSLVLLCCVIHFLSLPILGLSPMKVII